eukprot:14445427-Alexandrium_andersonii.AAC.1
MCIRDSSLPRGELIRRGQQRQEVDAWRNTCGASCACAPPARPAPKGNGSVAHLTYCLLYTSPSPRD